MCFVPYQSMIVPLPESPAGLNIHCSKPKLRPEHSYHLYIMYVITLEYAICMALRHHEVSQHRLMVLCSPEKLGMDFTKDHRVSTT